MDNKIYQEDTNYKINRVYKVDILDALEFDNNDDRLICSSIIGGIEKTIAEGIKSDKCVQIPHIGCMRKSIYHKAAKENKDMLMAVRRTLSKEDYKAYTKDYFISVKNKYKERDSYIRKVNKIKKAFRKKYNKFAKTISVTYANTFIYCMTLLRQVDYDEEIQEQFNLISNGEK